MLSFALPTPGGLDNVPWPVAVGMAVLFTGLALVGIRMLFVGVRITASALIERKRFRTHTVLLDDVQRDGAKPNGAGYEGSLELRAERSWSYSLQQANPLTHPRPFDRLDAVEARLAAAVEEARPNRT